MSPLGFSRSLSLVVCSAVFSRPVLLHLRSGVLSFKGSFASYTWIRATWEEFLVREGERETERKKERVAVYLVSNFQNTRGFRIQFIHFKPLLTREEDNHATQVRKGGNAQCFGTFLFHTHSANTFAHLSIYPPPIKQLTRDIIRVSECSQQCWTISYSTWRYKHITKY